MLIFVKQLFASDTDILTKKKVFEKVMGIRRLEEEEVVLVKEMKQHWEYLKRRAEVLEQSISGNEKVCMYTLTHFTLLRFSSSFN